MLPSDWIWRLKSPDYGIDLEIEMVEATTDVGYDGSKVVTDPDEKVVSGEIVWIQLKSIRGEKAGVSPLSGYNLETPLMRYAMGCTTPIYLVVVNIDNGEIYYAHLQGWLREHFQAGFYAAWVNIATVKVSILPLHDNDSIEVFKGWREIAREPHVTYEIV